MVFCRGVGQCFVRVDCVQRPTSSPPTHCHDSAVVSESASTKHSLQGMQTSSRCLHTLRRGERESGCYACKESLERHFENNDYVLYVVVCTALPLLSVTLVTLEQKQPCSLQGEASLIKDKDAKTQVYYHKFCQWLLFAFKGQHDTADLMKRFIGWDRCHCGTCKSLCLYFLLYGNL